MKLAETLNNRGFALTVECHPPEQGGADAVRELSACFPEGVDAVVVADHPDDRRGSALATAALLASQKRDPILSLVTRDRNRIALEADVLGAAMLGVEGILCLSGDHQSLGISPEASGVFDIDSIQLLDALRRMSEGAVGFDGKRLERPVPLFLGAAAHPSLRPLELNLIRLRKKIKAGANFFLTQAVFDLTCFEEWMEAVREEGLQEKAPILASVLPLGSVERAREVQARKTHGPVGDDVINRLADASDCAKEGVAICLEKVDALKSVPGVRGIHILAGGCERVAGQIIERAALARA